MKIAEKTIGIDRFILLRGTDDDSGVRVIPTL